MNYVHGSWGGYTAQIVIDDPKTSATDTGILNHRGEPLVRVHQAERSPAGFHTATRRHEPATTHILPSHLVIRR